MIKDSLWIGCTTDLGDICPDFFKEFEAKNKIKKATLTITAIGVYEAYINGARVGKDILTPGCTAFKKRLQYQSYDVTDMIGDKNELSVLVGTGWYRGRISAEYSDIQNIPCALIAELAIEYANGDCDIIRTDDSWQYRKSSILKSDIYDGETYDASAENNDVYKSCVLDLDKSCLIAQECEGVRERERLKACRLIVSPKGERILDFGQNMAGYPEINIVASKGERIKLSFAEILDSDGNFFTDNYRSAKCEYIYICRDGKQSYKPHFTFYGFRYIRLDEYPECINPEDITAIAIYTDMERTGYIRTANPKLNRFYENTLWSQRANFIDIPTDCPQRDERVGWTGDCQAFVKTASYNYNVKQFMEKWMHDLCAEQLENGIVPRIIPNFWNYDVSSTAWGDAVAIVPWQVYMSYGDTEILADSFDAMKKWVDYITSDTEEEYLWYSDKPFEELFDVKHFGDWLGLDAREGSYTGSSDINFISSAFYAYSTHLLIKAGKVLGKGMSEYEKLYQNIVSAFKNKFPKPTTHTEHVLALHFHLTDNPKEVSSSLDRMVREGDNTLITGFVGTPYILHALSDNGYTETAYSLLLQEKYPSWLYAVNRGATSIWEHLDGVNDHGTMWSADMNSFNHYCYGSACDWIYEKAAGIRACEDAPGYSKVLIEPHTDSRLPWLEASLKTKHGVISSRWEYCDDRVRYEISTPVPATIIIEGKIYNVEAGEYVF